MRATTGPPARIDRVTFGVWFGLAVLTAVFFYIHSSFVLDDAYITYRYARNLAQGVGFVYNANERVLGTTTPLFTLVLAAGAYVSQQDVVTVSLVVGLLSLWVGTGVLYQLGRAHSKTLGLAVALVYVTNPLLSQFVGMESYFLVCLLLLGIWAYVGRRLRLAALLCGLLVLVRFEMFLLPGVLAVVEFRSRRRLPYWLWPGLVPVLLWMLFAWPQFGSLIPLSVSAKLSASRVPFPVGAAVFAYIFTSQFPPAFVIIVLSVMGIMGALVLRRLPSRYHVIILFGLLYFCLASTVAGSFPWYYAPLLPAFAVMVVGGVQIASELPGAVRPAWDAQQRDWLARRLRWPIIAGVVAIQLVFWRDNYELRQHQMYDHRYVLFQEAAQWLNENAAPHQTLAVGEIGYLGYYSDVTIIDLSGLVTPGLIPWVKEGSNATLAHCLQLYAPDFVFIPSDDQPKIDIVNRDPRYQLEREFEHAYRLYVRKPG
jgi:arabinofuranosyltransferase